jgi:predicted DNA-binding WGR domain protein
MARKSQESSAGGSSAVAAPTGRELVFQDGSSNKFWRIELEGSSHTVTFGRVGTQGQTQTKEFASEAEARKSYDKLVAEKLKKGYTDSGASAGGSSAAAAAATVKAAGRKSAKASSAGAAVIELTSADGQQVAAVPAAAEEADLSITRSIDLAPSDWARATFRPRKPLERGEPRQFDQQACLDRLSKLRTETYGWYIRWRDLKLPAALLPQEAHFWLAAMTTSRTRDVPPKNLAKKLSGQKFSGQLSADEALKLIDRQDREVPDEVALLLANLLSVEELLELIQSKPNQRGGAHYSEAGGFLMQGFCNYVLPYLSDAQVAAARKALRKIFDPTKSPADLYEPLPVEFYLAAALGMHDEVYAVVSSWADNRYTTEDWADHYQRPQNMVFGLGSPELVQTQWRRLRLRMRSAEDVRAFLACTEYAALGCVRDSVLAETNKEKCEELLSVFALVRAPEAAEPMLECKLSSKTPGIARNWLDRNLGNAVAGLVGTAGGRGKLAEAAIDQLRSVKRLGHLRLIQDCLKSVKDKETAGKVQREVVDYEEKVYTPLDAKTTPDWLRTQLAAAATLKKSKLPSWAAPGLVPPIVLGERRLADDQMAAVLNTLAACPVTQGHPLLAELRRHAEPRSRDEFAWKLFQSWLEDGAPPKEKWALGAVGLLGGDLCAIKLTPLVRAWPGESQHQRAVLGLECLRAIGSDAALMQLSGIAQKLKFKGLKAKAEQFVNEIAAEKGMTRAELEDRIVPDCGLDENGRREFSFGPRSFSFVLGAELKPMLRDGDGKLRDDLPKPGAKDDAAVAQQSVDEWKLLKKQIKEVAKIQAGRLEQAMVTGRRWKVPDFELLLVRHPLMTHLAQKLIWGAYDKQGQLAHTFRVTEERDFADAQDNTASLAKSATVGVAHPLELAEDQRSTWGEVLSDYEIVSPFPQLGRPVYGLDQGEDKQQELQRHHGMKLVAPTLVFTLEKLGWIRGAAMDAGSFDEHSKQFPAANVTAVVEYEGTVGMGYISPDEELKVTRCYFTDGMRAPSGYGWGMEKRLKLGKVPPVVISEVLADLLVLKSKSK